MRRILALLVPVIASAVLAGCDGGDTPSGTKASTPNPRTSPGAEVTVAQVDCPRFVKLAERVAQAQADLYTGEAGNDGLKDLLAALDDLRDQAPAEIDAALDDLSAAFGRAEELVAEPATGDRSELQSEAARMAAAGTRISEYVLASC